MRMFSKLIIIVFTVFLVNARAEALCVTAKKVILKVGPGTQYQTTFEVFKYTPLDAVGKSLSGDWLAVKDVDGDIGWLPERLLTSSYRCAIVKTGKVNVRTGPGTRYAKSSLSPAGKYYSSKVLKQEGSWVQIEDESGNKGWIQQSYLWIQ